MARPKHQAPSGRPTLRACIDRDAQASPRRALRTRDPWAITAPCDPDYPYSWYGDGVYWTDGGDIDEIRNLIARGMEVD